MRVFLDTNVIISALLWEGGICDRLMHAVLEEFELIVGEYVLEETRKMLLQKFSIEETDVETFDAELRENEVIAQPLNPYHLPEEDPDDQWVLASAIEGKAQVLVTGDKDLLNIANKISEVTILSPREFMDTYL